MEAFKMTQIEAVKYPNLPLCDGLKEKTFFVRDCYEKYYDLLTKEIADPRIQIITLTGTPGIGKSIFYIYFFQRFKRENPNTTIITASYRNQLLEDCVVFESGSEGKTSATLPKLNYALYLFDGAPNSPPSNYKMITFSSPNPSWFDTIFKFMNVKKTYYLPCWDLEELTAASKLLNLKIAEEELHARFNVFGGSARVCFASTSVANECLSKLMKEIKSIQTEADFASAIDLDKESSTQYRNVFHFIPNCSRRGFQLTFCSRYVADQVYKNISKLDDDESKRLIRSLGEMNEAATLRGNLYNSYVSQLLKKGTTLRIVSLMRNEFYLNVCEESFIPCKKKNDDSFDSYLIHYNVIYLLKTTVYNTNAGMKTCSVSAKDIAKFINENLRTLKERILAGSILLRLLFVTLGGLNSFISQAIDPIKEVSESDPVTCIEGIGRNYEEQLSIYQIHTVGQLRQQINANRSQFVDSVLKAWDKFDEINAERSRWQFLGYIPQYFVQEFNVT